MRSHERGIALILVLWVFMALGVIALDFSRYIRDEATATINYADETHNYYAAIAGVNFAIWQGSVERICPLPSDDFPTSTNCADLDGDGKADNALTIGQWFEPRGLGEGQYKVLVEDEDGKIGINNADEVPVDVIRTVVTNLVRGPNATEGIDRHEQKDIDAIVDAIQSVRDKSGVKDSELGADHALALRRRSKVTWFQFIDELLELPGVTHDLFYGHGEGEDRVPGLANVFSRYSKGMPTKEAATPDVRLALGPLYDTLKSGGSVTPSQVRIRACADVRKERNQARIEAVVKIGSGTQPLVKLWIDRAPPWRDSDACTPQGEVS